MPHATSARRSGPRRGDRADPVAGPGEGTATSCSVLIPGLAASTAARRALAWARRRPIGPAYDRMRNRTSPRTCRELAGSAPQSRGLEVPINAVAHYMVDHRRVLAGGQVRIEDEILRSQVDIEIFELDRHPSMRNRRGREELPSPSAAGSPSVHRVRG